MSPVRPTDTLGSDRLILRRRKVAEAATYRRLWTERDPRVPPHRRIDAEGRPSVEDLAEQIRAESDEQGGGVAWADGVGFPRLWASVRDWSAPSRRVLEKLGFRETGRVEVDPVHGDRLLTVRELDRGPLPDRSR